MNQNSVVHFEVPFDDKERAMKFYAEVFGWQMQDMPEMQYVIARTTETHDTQMIKNPGAINGGMYKRGGGSSAHPVWAKPAACRTTSSSPTLAATSTAKASRSKTDSAC